VNGDPGASAIPITSTFEPKSSRKVAPATVGKPSPWIVTVKVSPTATVVLLGTTSIVAAMPLAENKSAAQAMNFLNIWIFM
jgi:hypothetical protein